GSVERGGAPPSRGDLLRGGPDGRRWLAGRGPSVPWHLVPEGHRWSPRRCPPGVRAVLLVRGAQADAPGALRGHVCPPPKVSAGGGRAGLRAVPAASGRGRGVRPGASAGAGAAAGGRVPGPDAAQ
ncbi:unnamed protein product, partial [Prorocentrum cordatum]